MLSFLKLIRYPNLIMVLLTMILTKYVIIETRGFSFLETRSFVFLSSLVILICATGYIINDIYDIEIDKINKPEKLYISKIISIQSAWKIYFTLIILTLFLGILFSHELIHVIIFLGTPLLLWLYAAYLKRLVLIGNVLVAFLVALPIYTVYLMDFIPLKTNVSNFDNPVSYAIFSYVFFSFLITLIREIIKDIEDINGDKKLHLKTLPILLGRERSKRITFIISLLLFLLLIFVLKIIKEEYPTLFGYSILFILVPLGYFLHRLWNATTKKDYSVLSKLLKVIMLSGILSMLFFKFK